MTELAFWRRIALTTLVLIGPAASEGPVTFDGPGGDAWTFEKLIKSSVAPGACDEVVIATPFAAVTAHPRDGQAIAHLPLAAGDNPVEAQCRRDGTRVGEPARQHWFVRLHD